MIEYKAEFFEHLERMIDNDSHGYHKCRDCGIVDGSPYLIRTGKNVGNKTGSNRRAVVRLCLIDESKPANDLNNIGYFCTTCRKGPIGNKKIPKSIRDSWPTLF